MDNNTTMKVGELIEKLEKQNPDDEVHILIDANVDEWAEDENERYYAKNMEIGHGTYYQSKHDILNEEEIEQYLIDNYDLPHWEESEFISDVYDEINTREELKGCWIKIKP